MFCDYFLAWRNIIFKWEKNIKMLIKKKAKQDLKKKKLKIINNFF